MNQSNQIKVNTYLLCIFLFSGIVMFSCRAKRIGAIQGASKDTININKNKKPNVPMDSLVWYKGPIDTFASYEAYKAYLTRERNLIRETPLGDFPPEVYIKMPDGSIIKEMDMPRASYHTKISNDSVPVFLKTLFPEANFYYAKLNTESGEFSSAYANSGDVICRINGKNYIIPNDVNVIFDETSKRKVSIEKKIELIISLRNGLHTNYKILSVVPKVEKVGPRLSNYEITFYINNKRYYGYLGIINKKEIDFFFMKEENGKDKGLLLLYSSKLSF
jgi:hypothetical protein